MRTLILLAAGFALLALFLVASRLFAGRSKRATTIAVAAFIVAWFAAAAWNLRVGVTQAGYSFAEELPIFLVLFLVPALAGLAAVRHLR